MERFQREYALLRDATNTKYFWINIQSRINDANNFLRAHKELMIGGVHIGFPTYTTSEHDYRHYKKRLEDDK